MKYPIAAATALAMVGMVAIFACTKTPDAPVAPVATTVTAPITSPVAAPVPAVPTVVAKAEQAQVPVATLSKTTPKAGVLSKPIIKDIQKVSKTKVDKTVTSDAAAYAVAYANAARANQLLGEHRFKVSATDK